MIAFLDAILTLVAFALIFYLIGWATWATNDYRAQRRLHPVNSLQDNPMPRINIRFITAVLLAVAANFPWEQWF